MGEASAARRDFTAPDEALAFFTRDEARTVEAAMARIFPDDELGPGAIEAGAIFYLDRALAGAEQHNQIPYRSGIAALNALARARFGAVFDACAPAEQDALVAALADDTASEFGGTPSGHAFFELLRAHTLEGIFSDPAHGGNRNLSGWKLLGYPGPQPGYSHAEQQLDAVIVRERIYTAADYPLPVADEIP
jgi:gluconate 2-dehydrogenase gamma chain